MWRQKQKILWRFLIESKEFNKSDIEYIKSVNLTDYSKLEVYERLTELTRRKITLREKKWFDAWYIAIDLNLEFWLVKQYLKQKNASKIIDWKKFCIWCDKWKNENDFQHTWKRIACRCRDCNNKIRREKKQNDPEYRRKVLEQQKKSKYKRKSRSELTEEKREREREIQRRYNARKRDKKLKNKIIKNRLLNK